ncbi:MAG: hypothetical protein IPF56_23610 [Chloroflexi bacterium]|nr:hypothetical protein [Chloroflexota bacterium]
MFSHRIFDVTQVLGAKPILALVPLLTGKETVQVAYLRSDTGGQHNAQSFDVDQVTDFRMIGINLLFQTTFYLSCLLFQEGDGRGSCTATTEHPFAVRLATDSWYQ